MKVLDFFLFFLQWLWFSSLLKNIKWACSYFYLLCMQTFFSLKCFLFCLNYKPMFFPDYYTYIKLIVSGNSGKQFKFFCCLKNLANFFHLSNYNRNTVISNNVFFRLGENGIVLVGETNLMDGTIGNQPRGTQILYNVVFENGVWVKQVCLYIYIHYKGFYN